MKFVDVFTKLFKLHMVGQNINAGEKFVNMQSFL